MEMESAVLATDLIEKEFCCHRLNRFPRIEKKLIGRNYTNSHQLKLDDHHWATVNGY
jgi:hypothetical protein